MIHCWVVLFIASGIFVVLNACLTFEAPMWRVQCLIDRALVRSVLVFDNQCKVVDTRLTDEAPMKSVQF